MSIAGAAERIAALFYDKGGAVFNVKHPDFGAVGDGLTDDTAAIQAALDAAVASNGGTLYFPAGTYVCGQINDTSTDRLHVCGSARAFIAPSEPTWLKIDPAVSKKGVVLEHLNFTLSACTDGVPVIWLEGTPGGITQFSIHDIDFGDCTGQYGDLLWLRACFNGSVGNLWCSLATGMKGVVVDQRNVNSGNIRFYDSTLAHIAVNLQFSKAYSSTGGQNLLNQLLVQNWKFVRSAQQLGMYNPVTLTAGATATDTTLTVSAPDATAVADAIAAGTPQFMVCGDATAFGDVIRVTAASGTTISLAGAIPTDLANGTILYCGTAGAVVGANAKGVRFDSCHGESVGAMVVLSHAQQVQLDNCLGPATTTYPSRMVYVTNGTQHVVNRQPIYGASGTGTTLHEIVNQGTIVEINLLEPSAYGSGSGPAAFIATTGTAFTTEAGLRFFRSADGLALRSIPYAASMTPDESYDVFSITVTDGNAFTIEEPTHRSVGRRVVFDIYNNSSGAMGTITWDQIYHLAGAFTNPADGKHRLIEFVETVITHNLRELNRSADDEN